MAKVVFIDVVLVFEFRHLVADLKLPRPFGDPANLAQVQVKFAFCHVSTSLPMKVP